MSADKNKSVRIWMRQIGKKRASLEQCLMPKRVQPMRETSRIDISRITSQLDAWASTRLRSRVLKLREEIQEEIDVLTGTDISENVNRIISQLNDLANERSHSRLKKLRRQIQEQIETLAHDQTSDQPL
jgi:hypothetical protein